MGGRGSWSASSGGTFDPTPGGGGGGAPETVLGPRIPETLDEALGTRGRPMSKADASMGTNPHYSPDYDAYSSNCQRCVLAYEARRRGYDVTALPPYHGDLLPSGSDYLKALSNPEIVSVGRSARRIESRMQQYGAGSRAIVRVASGRNGHVFIAENVRGRVTYIDPQTNSRYSGLRLSHVTSASLIRLDNQQFTEYARNAFTRQKV
jgi:hypothetical protein